MQREPQREDMQLSVQYNSVSNWKVAHNSLHAQDCYLNIIKFIFLRESALIKVRDLVLNIDEMYWRYANTYIARKLYFKNNTVSDELHQMQVVLHTKQELMSVALAHLRSLSIDIVEGVQKWRACLQKDVSMRDVASVFWNGRNYLIKMLKDIPQLFHTQTMLMWLGFEVNSFIVPPRHLNPHTERVNRARRAQQWKQKRDEHNTAALKRLMSQQVMYRSAAIIDRDAVRRQTQTAMNKPSTRRGRLSSSDEDGGDGAGGGGGGGVLASSQSTPTLPPIGASAQTLARQSKHTQSAGVLAKEEGSLEEEEEGEESESVTATNDDDDDEYSRGSSTVTSVLTEVSGSGWRELRDSCLPSWKYFQRQRQLQKERSNLQSSDVLFEQEQADDFWEDIDHSEHLVEAAAGYVDLYPKKYIVPPLKRVLISRCESCERVLLEEVEMAARVQENIAVSREMLVELDREKLKLYLDNLSSEEKRVEQLIEMEKVRRRQETMTLRDHCRPNEISRQYVANQLDSRQPQDRYISSARGKSRGRGTGRTLSPSRASPTRSAERLLSPATPLVKNNNMFAVFLTAPTIAIDTDFSMSTQSFIPENIDLKIDPDVLSGRIKCVVDNDRQACIRAGSSLVLRTRENRNNRARALKNKSTKRRNALDAIVFMQALIRGVITRSRLARINKIQSRMAATLFLQSCLKRYIRRCRARVKRRLFKADCLRVRREILVSHRSADVIKTFFRYVIFLRKRIFYLHKYSSIEKLDVVRNQNVLRAVSLIQRAFRGYSTRSWWWSIIIESRKRQKVYGKIGPKFRRKVVLASRRSHHFTVAGSGGFAYRWKKNYSATTSADNFTLFTTEMSICSTFMTIATGSSFNLKHGGTEQANRSSASSPCLESKQERMPSDDMMMHHDSSRRGSVGAVSDESLSVDDMSLSLTNSNGVATARALELKKRTAIRNKIAMLNGGARSHHKGVNLLRAVPTKERAFLPNKIPTLGSGGNGGRSMSSLDSAPRSHTLAYENPNVHFKAKQARHGRLSGSLYSSTSNVDLKKTNELNGLLTEVYGFQKS